MTTEFWDNRYSADEYIFGTEPNDYFKQQIDRLKPGKILVAAAGEGRDAVYAATKGWEVFAFDQSKVAKEKAIKLAKSKNTEINYQVKDAFIYDFVNESYDCIAFIFFHLPSDVRKKMYKKLIPGLRKGGHIILESFNPLQLNNSSGGPKDLDMLLTKEILEEEFEGLQIIENLESEIVLNEGNGHAGKANTMRFFAVKLL